MRVAEVERESALKSDSFSQALRYLSGFGNEFATECVAGALPQGQNNPQRPPHGLYAELLSGTAFTSPRAENRRTWMYRRRPSAAAIRFRPYAQTLWMAEASPAPAPPEPLRWRPLDIPDKSADFVDGMRTMAFNGHPDLQTGVAVHLYVANRSMEGRALANADGEMLLVPQQGEIRLTTELGLLSVKPGEVAVIPRGISFSAALPDGASRGYVCENYGSQFRLPELGPIGSNGLANARDFSAPVAACAPDVALADFEILRKTGGRLWSARQSHSPFDVMAWHGNLVPYKYDTSRFMAMGSISFDHPDPSIFTVLTSPSDTPGTANCDFVIFPPRWLVAEQTFRPPWFHRNVMSEFMGLVHGRYDAKAEGFLPGGASLHNCMVPHGPDAETFDRASREDLTPQKIDDTLAIMFESRYRLIPTAFAMTCGALDDEYVSCWAGLQTRSKG